MVSSQYVTYSDYDLISIFILYVIIQMVNIHVTQFIFIFILSLQDYLLRFVDAINPYIIQIEHVLYYELRYITEYYSVQIAVYGLERQTIDTWSFYWRTYVGNTYKTQSMYPYHNILYVSVQLCTISMYQSWVSW